MENKISLNLLIQGAELDPHNYEKQKVTLTYMQRQGKKIKEITRSFYIKVRKNKLITQHINIPEEAYQYMLSTPPSSKLLKGWKTASIDKKLKSHFDLIAEDLGAESYNYEILED